MNRRWYCEISSYLFDRHHAIKIYDVEALAKERFFWIFWILIDCTLKISTHIFLSLFKPILITSHAKLSQYAKTLKCLNVIFKNPQLAQSTATTQLSLDMRKSEERSEVFSLTILSKKETQAVYEKRKMKKLSMC
jgi:hypothetical protein